MLFSFQNNELKQFFFDGVGLEDMPEDVRIVLCRRLDVLEAAQDIRTLLKIPVLALDQFLDEEDVYMIHVLGPWYLVFRAVERGFTDVWLKCLDSEA